MAKHVQRKQSKQHRQKSRTAKSLIDNKDLKFIFVGGKGGVGKTTTSSAIAMQLSYDRKVLLLSTDPAHSLSDAFRCSFTGEVSPVEGVPNLEVMEINPDKALSVEIQKWQAIAEEAGYDELLKHVKEFQEWLINVPGIDEASALSGVIDILEKGSYDVIVFDTAPTGHTLKLLQLPKVLEAGLNKLESWQSKIWGYWSMIKSTTSGSGNMVNVQQKVAQRLKEYKTAVEKIGFMLKDNRRTTFAIVCIAEHLSINESLRLLDELEHYNIAVSHIFVNQLVQDALLPQEMDSINDIFARANLTQVERNVIKQMKLTVQLCNSRRGIQQTYLKKLEKSTQVTSNGITVVELPLLPSEVTGAPALLHFSQLLMPKGYRTQQPFKLEAWNPSPVIINLPQKSTELKAETETEKKIEVKDETAQKTNPDLKVGDRARIQGLKSTQYNGLECNIIAPPNTNGRFRVSVKYQDAVQKLLLKRTNLTRIDSPIPKKQKGDNTKDTATGLRDKALLDPEVQEKLKNPRFKAAWDDCQNNPMNALQYMMDPEIGPFMTKMMGKLTGGNMFGQ